ncbi:Detected protein of confused Function [Hibiscus syriacus]|uniref:Detected protein of confused Function n=1 Tax=Hibiscus syriacus TaxID=106335 RepID=A0A6A3AFZ8_HIBSY|nr:Detected protein of confused Function [Hibiscus syriacus]
MAFLAKALRNPTFIKQLAQQRHVPGVEIGRKRRLAASPSLENLQQEAVHVVVDNDQVDELEELTTIESEIETFFTSAMDNESSSEIKDHITSPMPVSSVTNTLGVNDTTWEELINEDLIGGESREELVIGDQAEVDVQVEDLAANPADWVDDLQELSLKPPGSKLEVLSAEEEARFLPVFDNRALNVDIGGGSTEFAIGLRGKVEFCSSLKLGNVTLTLQNFGDEEAKRAPNMRNYTRNIVKESGLIEKVKNFGFEIALGSSGTIRAIEKAVSKGHALDFAENEALFSECKGDWSFSRDKLNSVVESNCKG